MRRLDRKEQDHNITRHMTYSQRERKKTKMNALHIKKTRRLASPITKMPLGGIELSEKEFVLRDCTFLKTAEKSII